MAKQPTWILDERRFFSRDEQRRLRDGARRRSASSRRDDLLTWFLVELAFETGLRVNEMRLLTCDDLRLDVAHPGVCVTRGKGGESRFVAVRPAFVRSCRIYLALKRRWGEPATGTAPVFTGPSGSLSVRALQRRFERLCRSLGARLRNLHACRHSYATALLRASGGNLRMVQKQLGHARVTTTQTYADVYDEDRSAALRRLYH